MLWRHLAEAKEFIKSNDNSRIMLKLNFELICGTKIKFIFQTNNFKISEHLKSQKIFNVIQRVQTKWNVIGALNNSYIRD